MNASYENMTGFLHLNTKALNKKSIEIIYLKILEIKIINKLLKIPLNYIMSYVLDKDK
jgi:hypothetical protein